VFGGRLERIVGQHLRATHSISRIAGLPPSSVTIAMIASPKSAPAMKPGSEYSFENCTLTPVSVLHLNSARALRSTSALETG